jgi:hypothetical protein
MIVYKLAMKKQNDKKLRKVYESIMWKIELEILSDVPCDLQLQQFHNLMNLKKF